MAADLSKHTMMFRKGDFAFLQDRFPKMGASAVIRKITSDFIDKLDRPVDEKQVEEILAAEEAEQVNG